MSTSANFTYPGFSVFSATAVSPTVIKLRFTSDPIAFSPANSNDALNPANYAFSGPGPLIISAITPDPTDTQSVVIFTTNLIGDGPWLVTVSNVQSMGGYSLITPKFANFTVDFGTSNRNISRGAKNKYCRDLIRANFPSYFKGPIWEALIDAVGKGDCWVFQQAALSYNQLYSSSASGIYLERRGSDVGISKPFNLGLTDDSYRQLIIKKSTGKVTQPSIRSLLEIFYGQDALRATLLSDKVQPFALEDGQYVDILCDNVRFVRVQFSSSDFKNISSASALEVSAIINRSFRAFGYAEYCVPFVNPETDETHVKIFSATSGQAARLQVLGGMAQNAFHFATARDTYLGNVSGGSYSWVYSSSTLNDETTVSLTKATSGNLVALETVVPGDYVNINTSFLSGTFVIKNVSITYSGSNKIQSFVISNQNVTGSYLQTSNDQYSFFESTIVNNVVGDGRDVVVSQTAPQKFDIVLPATTEIVARTSSTGSYWQESAATPLVRVLRQAGISSFYSSAGIDDAPVGSTIDMEGGFFSSNLPYLKQANTVTSPFYSSATRISNFSPATDDIDFPERILNSWAWCPNSESFITQGGWTGTASSPTMISDSAQYEQVSYLPLSNGSQANGAYIFDYTTTAPPSLSALADSKLSTATNGNVYMLGGWTAYASSTDTYTPSAGAYSFDGSAWNTLTSPSLSLDGLTTPYASRRIGHCQLSDVDGKIYVLGGYGNGPGFSAKSQTHNNVWALDTNSNSYQFLDNAMITARADASAVIQGGEIYVAGGILNSSMMQYDSSIFGAWEFNNTIGLSYTDLSGSGWTLTTGTAGSPRRDRFGKNSLLFGATTQLLTNSAVDAAFISKFRTDFTIEAWCRPNTTVASDLVSINTSGGAAADLVTVRLGTTGGTYGVVPYLSYQVGSTPVINLTSPTEYPVDPLHLCIRRSSPAATDTWLYKIELIVNGQVVQSSTVSTNYGPFTDGATTRRITVGGNFAASTYFDGSTSQLRLSDVAKSYAEIALDFRQGSATYSHYTLRPTGSGSADLLALLGLPTNKVEKTVSKSSWVSLPDMNYARAGHSLVALPNGNLLAIGGFTFDPTKGMTKSFLGGPGVVLLKSIELYDAGINQWRVVGELPIATYKNDAVYIPSLGKIVVSTGHFGDFEYYTNVVGGTPPKHNYLLIDANDFGMSFASAETFGLNKRIVKNPEDLVLISGTNDYDSAVSHDTSFKFFIPGKLTSTSGQINAPSVIVSTTSSPFHIETSSILGEGDTFEPLTTSALVPLTASRTSNVTTFVCSEVDSSIGVGALIYINSEFSSISSGLRSVTAVTSTSISISDTGSNFASTSLLDGTRGVYTVVFALQKSSPVATAYDASGDGGFFIYDPLKQAPVSPITTSLSGAIPKNSTTSTLNVASTSTFPESGWIQIGFGEDYSTKPIQYLSKISSTQFLISSSFVFASEIPNGATITYLYDNSPYAPSANEGQLRLTASNAGLAGALSTIDDAIPTGMNGNVEVIYPGDRGLAGEGTVNSESPYVWGPDILV